MLFILAFPLSISAQVNLLGNTDSVKTMNGIAISPDFQKLYSSWVISPNRNHNRKYQTRIFEYRLIDGVYRLQGQISFSGRYIDYHPILSPDGKRMYFNSLRPVTDDTTELIKNNLWYADLIEGKWAEPKPVPDINTDAYESYASVTQLNNLYFVSNRPGGMSSDIYVSHFSGNKYESPVNLREINGSFAENDICVDPLERFLIFNVFDSTNNHINMYITYRNQNQWSKPEAVKVFENEDKTNWILNPALTPDGKFFLYERNFRIKRLPIHEVVDMERIK